MACTLTGMFGDLSTAPNIIFFFQLLGRSPADYIPGVQSAQ